MPSDGGVPEKLDRPARHQDSEKSPNSDHNNRYDKSLQEPYPSLTRGNTYEHDGDRYLRGGFR